MWAIVCWSVGFKGWIVGGEGGEQRDKPSWGEMREIERGHRLNQLKIAPWILL